jgi:hypothetical protein
MPYVTFVYPARNDNHGGHMLQRMQTSLSVLALQCERYGLDAELVVVEWNPPADKPRLHEELSLPSVGSRLKVVFVEVPHDMHMTLENSDKLFLFQMIAKNVGLRRARGEFVCATNLDIVFTDELIAQLARRELDPKDFYRADRFDVGVLEVPQDVPTEGIVAFCKAHIIRGHLRDGSREMTAPCAYQGLIDRLATNACGDFTMMQRAAWDRCRGYPELAMNDLYVDGLGVHMAYAMGLREVLFSDPCFVMHLEHEGSYQAHTTRIKRCKNLDYETEYIPWCRKMVQERRVITVNSPRWGFADHAFKETVFGV